MDGHTPSAWFATGVAALLFLAVIVVLVRCVWALKRSPRDE